MKGILRPGKRTGKRLRMQLAAEDKEPRRTTVSGEIDGDLKRKRHELPHRNTGHSVEECTGING